MRRNRSHSRRSSVAEPRRALLLAVCSFVRAASVCPGVLRIALIGSLVTNKSIPKDADVLVTIDDAMDLSDLARAGRRLKGFAQTINLGADIFLADANECYLGRICQYRECHPRVACLAQHCGRPPTSTMTFMLSRCRKNCLLPRQLTFGQSLSDASPCRLMSKRYC
jgi:hypothetical protein